MYYNTNKETGDTLLKSRDKAERQENIILAYFKRSLVPLYAPHELEFLFDHKATITSPRRALNKLVKEGKLIKTNKMVMGTYGKMVHTWELVSYQTELEL